jgi:hypothetical protein
MFHPAVSWTRSAEVCACVEGPPVARRARRRARAVVALILMMRVTLLEKRAGCLRRDISHLSNTLVIAP